MQDVYPKTLSLCIVVEHCSKKPAIPTLFCDMQEEIMECGTLSTPLHLKIAAWYDARKRSGDKLPFALDDLKKVLMPRQALLKKLDPSGSLTVPEVRVALEPYQRGTLSARI